MKVIEKEVKCVFNDLFKIDQAIVRFEKFDGRLSQEVRRLNFNRGHSVAILLYNPDENSVVLTRQFRYPAYAGDKQHAWISEIVAGMLEKEENPETCVIRETLEETGYHVKNPKFIFDFFVSPGGTSEKIYLYYATVTHRDRTHYGGGLDAEGEDIQVNHIKLPDALNMLTTGEICDAKTIIALQWFEKNFDAIFKK